MLVFDERLGRVCGEVRFVQRGHVNDGLDTPHHLADEITVGDRSNGIGEGRGIEIDAAHGPGLRAQASHQGFAQVSSAAGDEDSHVCAQPANK